MFSDAGGGGGDDDDFGEFGGNRKLASLFGGSSGVDGNGSRRNSSSPGGASSDLKYSAPKQPTKAVRGASMTSQSSGGGVMYALPVHAHRYVDGKPLNEGPLGAAVVATATSTPDEPRRFQLLLYKANKQPVSTATITTRTPTMVAGVDGHGSNYVQFNPDVNGSSWSLSVKSTAEATRFCAHVALAQALSATTTSQMDLTNLHAMDAVVGEGPAVGPHDGIEVKYTGWLVQGETVLSYLGLEFFCCIH